MNNHMALSNHPRMDDTKGKKEGVLQPHTGNVLIQVEGSGVKKPTSPHDSIPTGSEGWGKLG